MHAQPKANPPRAGRFWLIWLTSIVVCAALFVYLSRPGPLGVKQTIFRQTPQGWQALPPLDGLYEIRISDSGAVWARTAHGLNRLVGASWYHFTSSDLGSDRRFLPVSFALDNDDVWAAAADGVAHFDGRIWTRYSNIVDARFIVAREGHVWAIDEAGNLTHFDGVEWTRRQASMPDIWPQSNQKPQLAITSNGALWLVFRGLWRYDGQSWKAIQGASKYAQLLGVTPAGEYYANGRKFETDGALWVRDGFAVLAFNVHGSLWARYWPQDLGLPQSALAYGVSGRPPLVALASSHGLSRFDGSRWEAEQPPPLGLHTVTSIAVDPDLSIWGVARSPVPTTGRFQVGAALFAFLILAMFAIFYPIVWAAQTRHLPRRETSPLKARLAPWMLIVAFVTVLALRYPDAIAQYFHFTLLPHARMFWFFIGIFLLWHAYDLARAFYVERQLRAGQYQRALDILLGPLRFPTTGIWKLLRAQVLFYWDRAAEAEPILRKLIETARGPGHQAMAYENLGRALMAQGRYQEAGEAYKSVAALMPTRSTWPNGLAELRLRHGIEPERALEYAEQALRLYQASGIEHRSAKERLAAIRGNQAWALAALGRSAEAQKAIKAARADLDTRHIPETAAFHWRAGMTMLALGDHSASETHLFRATKLDRIGYYGKLAAQQLAAPVS